MIIERVKSGWLVNNGSPRGYHTYNSERDLLKEIFYNRSGNIQGRVIYQDNSIANYDRSGNSHGHFKFFGKDGTTYIYTGVLNRSQGISYTVR